jgi:predicted secreted protein
MGELMFLILAFALASGAPGSDQPAAAVPAAPAAAPAKKEKKICRIDEATSGSRMAKRLCLTEEEWAQRSQGMTQSARSGFSGKSEDH